MNNEQILNQLFLDGDDLITMKKISGRPKDLEDIMVLEVLKSEK